MSAIDRSRSAARSSAVERPTPRAENAAALAAVLLGFLVQIAERRVEIRPLRFEISILVGVRRRRLTGLVAEKPDQ